METECHKCGAPTVRGEPFCGRCGAVVGMRDAAQRPEDASPSYAATVVGKPAANPLPRPASQSAPNKAPRRPQTPETAGAEGRAGNGARHLIIGFAAVLLFLLLLWLWMNSGG